MRWSSTGSGPKRRRPSGTSASPRRAISAVWSRVMSSPPRRTAPACLGRRPHTALTSVVLPAPFAPSSATISPGATRSDTRRRAWILPEETLSSATLITLVDPQIGLDHLWRRLDLRGNALRDLPSEVEHHDPVGHLHDESHLVLDQEG